MSLSNLAGNIFVSANVFPSERANEFQPVPALQRLRGAVPRHYCCEIPCGENSLEGVLGNPLGGFSQESISVKNKFGDFCNTTRHAHAAEGDAAGVAVDGHHRVLRPRRQAQRHLVPRARAQGRAAGHRQRGGEHVLDIVSRRDHEEVVITLQPLAESIIRHIFIWTPVLSAVEHELGARRECRRERRRVADVARLRGAAREQQRQQRHGGR
eukprot:gene10104-biopygen8064